MKVKKVKNGVPVADEHGNVTTISIAELTKLLSEQMGVLIVDEPGELTFVAGGRNLLPDSEKELSAKSGSNFTEYGGRYENVEIFDRLGEGDYTLSFDARSVDTAGKLLIYWSPGAESDFKYSFERSYVNVTKDWKRYAMPLKLRINNQAAVKTALGFLGSDITPAIRKLKIERGNIATDWTPAPEDIEKRLTELEKRGGVDT